LDINLMDGLSIATCGGADAPPQVMQTLAGGPHGVRAIHPSQKAQRMGHSAFYDTIRIYAMRYEWDERKNEQNQRKHGGISFELAVLAFRDDRRLIEFDRVDETGEQRWHALGRASVRPGIAAILLVVHAYREAIDGEETIRIISARRAGPRDIRRYQEQAVD
jgi:uncharacterized DUF497 family protein